MLGLKTDLCCRIVDLRLSVKILQMFALFLIIVQKPAPADDIKVTPSDTSAQVTLGNPTPETSSYITYYYIYLAQNYIKRISRQKSRTELFSITELKPNTKYTVKVVAFDDFSQRSSSTYKEFMTIEAGK